MIEVFKSLYGFAWVVKDGGSTSRYSLLFFLQSGKTTGNVGLAFKKHVKGGWIHIFHIIPLSYSVLQCCEGVKDAAGILFLK